MGVEKSRTKEAKSSFDLSDRLRRFLISNNIFKIENLENLSMKVIASLRDYDASIRKEVLRLKPNKGKKDLTHIATDPNSRDKSAQPPPKGPIKECIPPITVHEMPCSTRLSNVIIKRGYEFRPLEFLALKDSTLMRFRDFGKTTLAEVQTLRWRFKVFLMLPNSIETSQVTQVMPATFIDEDVIPLEFIISIPAELMDLAFESILFFQRWIRPVPRNRLTRLLVRFSTLSAIDGFKKSDLYRIPGIGRASVKTLLQWLEYFHTGSFQSLVDRLTTHRNYHVSHISCSRELHAFLREHYIRIINEITSLDSMDFAEAKEPDKLAILELRTLNIHPGTGKLMTGVNFASSSQTVIEAIDNFLGNEVSSKRRSILLGRWGEAEGRRTLQEVGHMHGLTRERVRQVVEQEIIRFRKGYVLNEENLLGFFYKVVMSILSPISFSDLTQGKQQKPQYNEEFYLGFLSEVFDTVPFEGYLYAGRTCPPTEGDIALLTSEPDLVELGQHFMQMSNEDRLSHLKAIFLSERLTLARRGDKVYVNQNKYSMIPVLKQCIRINDSPTHLNEYCSFLENHPLYDTSFNRESVYNALNRMPEFVTVDYHVWGLERHLSYSENDWPAIQEAVRHILKRGDQQINASILYDLVRKNFRMLRSKYELVHILRNDPQIRDLGFFTFVLKESDQTERIKIVDVIAKLFKQDPMPKHCYVIWEKVSQERSWGRTGIHSGLKQIQWLEEYKPSYYGLKNRRADNLLYLSRNPEYINKYITYCYPHTSMDEIRTGIGFTDTEEEFINLVTLSDKIFVLPSSNNREELYLMSRDWDVLQLILCILANSKSPIFLDEILFTLKDDLGFSFPDRSRLLYRLENSIRVRRLKNGSFEYNEVLDAIEAYFPLLYEIETFLVTTRDLTSLEDLYETITSRSTSQKPDSLEELRTLLEFDNRFVILADNLVGLL